MAAPPLLNNDIVRVKLQGLLNNQLTVNTFDYRIVIFSGDVKSFDDLATAFSFNVTTALNQTVTADWVLTRVAVSRNFPDPSAEVYYGPPTYTPQAVPAVPPQVACVIQKKTYNRGPSGRGRIFVPGFPAAFVVAGKMTVTGNTAFGVWSQFVKATLLMGVAGSGAIPVIYHRATHNSNDIQYCQVNPIPRTQKRRVIGIGK